VTIGPVVENGFYYDFSFKRPFTPEDLGAIETRMAELAKKDFPVTREVWPRDKAVQYFKSIGEHYKAEIIASIPPDEEVSLYREGISSICVAVRTFPPLASSRSSSSPRSPAPIGAAIPGTRCCSGSTGPPGPRRRNRKRTCA